VSVRVAQLSPIYLKAEIDSTAIAAQEDAVGTWCIANRSTSHAAAEVAVELIVRSRSLSLELAYITLVTVDHTGRNATESAVSFNRLWQAQHDGCGDDAT